MAINKRLRFEVLKRDGFRCTYCGATPKDKELHVDHVIPESLGGTPIPENLTTACGDCNRGKASASASDEMVAAVDEAVAIEKVVRARTAERLQKYAEEFGAYETEVVEIWDYYVPTYRQKYAGGFPMLKVEEWFNQGVPIAIIEYAVRVAVAADVAWSGKVPYAIAVVRNKIQEARDATD